VERARTAFRAIQQHHNAIHTAFETRYNTMPAGTRNGPIQIGGLAVAAARTVTAALTANRRASTQLRTATADALAAEEAAVQATSVLANAVQNNWKLRTE
jgi:hypothetical protein